MDNFGWWRHDSSSQSLTNRVTGETVSFCGPCSYAGNPVESSGANFIRFDYQARDQAYPIIAQILPQHTGNSSDYAPLFIDHDHCADVWAREGGKSDVLPPFGLWSNVDTAIVDALLCRARPNVRKYLHVQGGWFNGVWSSNVRRIFEGLVPDISPGQKNPVSDPAIFLLNPQSSAENSWQSVKNENGLSGPAAVNLDETIRLSRPTGFEDKVSYFANEQRTRVLFPSRAIYERVRMEMGTWLDDGYVECCYADSDIAVLFYSKPSIGSKFATWEFRSFQLVVDHLFGGQLTDLVASPAQMEHFSRAACNRPQFILWRRIADALVNGWLNWQNSQLFPYGTRLTQDDDSSGEILPSCDRLVVIGGYVAGVPSMSSKQYVSQYLSFQDLFGSDATYQTADLCQAPDNQWLGKVEADRSLKIRPDGERLARSGFAVQLNFSQSVINGLIDDRNLDSCLAAFMWDLKRNYIKPGFTKKWKISRILQFNALPKWDRRLIDKISLRSSRVAQAFLIAVTMYREMIENHCNEYEKNRLRHYLNRPDPDQAALPDDLLQIRCGIYVALHHARNYLSRDLIEFGVREIFSSLFDDPVKLKKAVEFIMTGAENLPYGGKNNRDNFV